MKELQLSRLVDMENPQSVLDEVRVMVLVMFPEFDFDSIERVFRDGASVHVYGEACRIHGYGCGDGVLRPHQGRFSHWPWHISYQ
jgi:hypothetical protein